MRKGKYILLMVIFLAFVTIAGACIYLYPAWKAAEILQEKMDSSYRSFVLEIELDEEELTEEQTTVFETLAKFTGISKQSMCRLTIEGGAQGDRIHMTIYPEGESEPLLETYLSNDISVINETMLYEAIRNHMTGQIPFLDYFVPRQEENLYMTFEQVEQLFGTDLSEIRRFGLPVTSEGFTAKQYFLMLAFMSKEKREEGYRFGLEAEGVRFWFDISDKKEDGTVRMGLRIQNPTEAFGRGEDFLSRFGITLPEGDFHALKSFSMVLTPESEGTITIPTNLVNQKTIDIISKIRIWIEENIDKKSEDSTEAQV